MPKQATATNAAARKAASPSRPKATAPQPTRKTTTAKRAKASTAQPPRKSHAPQPRAAKPSAPPPGPRAGSKPRGGLGPKDLIVQSDLALKDARDQWSRLTAELERRRQAVDRAVRQLRDTGADASHALVDAARQAVDELSEAVDAILGSKS
jgi:hypothetical protein